MPLARMVLLKIHFVKIYLSDLRSVQTDRGIIAVIICHEKTVLRFYDCGITIAVGGIAFQQSTTFFKGNETAVAEGFFHVRKGKSAIFADCHNERGSFGAFPVLAVFAKTMIADGIEDGKRIAVRVFDLHGGVGRRESESGRNFSEGHAAVIGKALILMTVCGSAEHPESAVGKLVEPRFLKLGIVIIR